ncbi:protein of unknown function [Cribrihabitans marinus]|uniref:DUF4169 domain-containing protein n=1 Tax=Cribrihabitans marinus TaxID=1227549 RepID=A0A1H6QG80_9RHOB|nr:DUF4169 family protein [Cribrihabitans marinus]GGH18809.1 hypothetical protein GCM10010973_01830 [Cribrihabitans marinus]SEI42721.1 protein of unknown function [Cribrihabitans marinus]
MAKVINLRKARKTAERSARKARADKNAAKHGRSKAGKSLDKARAEKARRDLDGHEIEP